MSTDIERHETHSPVTFTTAEAEALRDTIGADMSDAQFTLFLAQASRLGLDPISRQCYGWVDRGKVVMMTSIDGLRVVCSRTGKFRGIIGPQWCGDDGVWTGFADDGAPNAWLSQKPPAAARVGILHADYDKPVWGVATFAQYGKTHGVWKAGAPHMLAKCAEAIARRTAFPQDLAGVYTDDEIDTVTATREPKPGKAPDPAPIADIEHAMRKFYSLPDEGADKVEERWAKMLESWPGEKPGTVDDGALFEVPEQWFRPMEQLLDKATQHYQTDPFEVITDRTPEPEQATLDDVVEGEVVG